MRSVRSLVIGLSTVLVVATACGTNSSSSSGTLPEAGMVIRVYPDTELARQVSGPTTGEAPSIAPDVTLPPGPGDIYGLDREPDVERLLPEIGAALGIAGTDAVPLPGTDSYYLDGSGDQPGGLRSMGRSSWMYLDVDLTQDCSTNDPDGGCWARAPVPAEDALATMDRLLSALQIEPDRVDVTAEPGEFGGTSVQATARRPDSGNGRAEWSNTWSINATVTVDDGIIDAWGMTGLPEPAGTTELIDTDELRRRIARSPSAPHPGDTVTPGQIPTTPNHAEWEVGAGKPIATNDEIISIVAGHDVVWAADGLPWLMPTYSILTSGGTSRSIFAVPADIVEVVDSREAPDVEQQGPIAVPPPTIVDPMDTIPPPPRTGPAITPPPTGTVPHPPTTTATTIAPPGGVAPPTTPSGPAPPNGPELTTTSTTIGISVDAATGLPIPPDAGRYDEHDRLAYLDHAFRTMSRIVIGMAADEAAAMLRPLGWVVTVTPHGPDNTMTPDLVWDRVTLYTDDGVVVRIVAD